MWIKNNSNRGWEKYNCGKGVMVDVEPNSEFEVDNEAGMVLLRNLGADAWLVQIPGPSKEVKEEKLEEPKELPKEKEEEKKEEKKEEPKKKKGFLGFKK